MKLRPYFAFLALSAATAPPALAGTNADFRALAQPAASAQPKEVERNAYAAIFRAIDAGQWDVATTLIDAAPDSPLRPVARAEYYLAPNSPRVDLGPLLSLIDSAPWLPQAEQLSRLAAKRGATVLPTLPQVRKLSWLGSAPRRGKPATVSDAAAMQVRDAVLAAIKADNPAEAERLVEQSASALGAGALTEWRQRVAWSYYIENDDASARRVAAGAVGSDAWATQARWVAGLASWRLRDYAAAEAAFDATAQGADDLETRAAALYWGSRASVAARRPQAAQAKLQGAAQYRETFYGLLAAQALGIAAPVPQARSAAIDPALASQPAVAATIALAGIGRTALAEETLRHAAETGEDRAYPGLLSLARSLDLPRAQLWLAHRGPAGTRNDVTARYPAPHWTPAGGWRVDPALAFAHALQESQFDTRAVSQAGARGLMQVVPGTAQDFARRRGASFTAADLGDPAINLEYGQSFLEQLRDMSQTEGLLPKVIAAYNAGPTPVGRWRDEVRCDGDPLLWIESIPYAETRAYVGIVLRNYWMYQRQGGGKSASLAGLSQNMWPRFPGATGESAAVRLMRAGPSAVHGGPQIAAR